MWSLLRGFWKSPAYSFSGLSVSAYCSLVTCSLENWIITFFISERSKYDASACFFYFFIFNSRCKGEWHRNSSLCDTRPHNANFGLWDDARNLGRHQVAPPIGHRCRRNDGALSGRLRLDIAWPVSPLVGLHCVWSDMVITIIFHKEHSCQ